ncbi:UDP-3-O-(3-hydroxymyristoyl)glucosamine N-acyltransferase [Aliikangiella sp. IMCC44653]
MSRWFNKNITLRELGVRDTKICSSVLDKKLHSISDPSDAAEFSICIYLKGELPKCFDSLILITNKVVEGYNCYVVDNPKFEMNNIIRKVQETIGFKELYKCKPLPSSLYIGKNVVIEEDVEIGEGTFIDHNVVIKSGTKIGKDCYIGANTSIGVGGFNFFEVNKKRIKQQEVGGVVIEDNVEIGSSACIARGIYGETVIGKGTKIDNLVHIAHDCTLNNNCLVIAQAGISGYVFVGENAKLAPNSCVRQRLTIGRDATVGIGAIALKDVEDSATVFGNPARQFK